MLPEEAQQLGVPLAQLFGALADGRDAWVFAWTGSHEDDHPGTTAAAGRITPDAMISMARSMLYLLSGRPDIPEDVKAYVEEAYVAADRLARAAGLGGLEGRLTWMTEEE